MTKRPNSIISVNDMLKHDIHIHTHLSDCADRQAFMRDYIEAARQHNLEIIGFADHAWDESIIGASDWYKPQTYKRLIARRDELKSIDTTGLKVLLGAEGEYANLLLGLGDEGKQYVDYVIIPHSHTHMRGFVLPDDCVGNPEKHANYLVKSFIALCRHEKRELFLGIAHPMSPIGMNGMQTEEIFSFISDAMLDECAQAAKEADILLEANLSILKGIPPEASNGYCLRRFYDACKRAGCQFFIGSDAHKPASFNNYHADKESLLQLIGLAECDFTTATRRIRSV